MISSILISGAIIVGALAGDDVPKDRTDLDAYHAAAARAGHDANAHIRLALWCEAHGLSAERVTQLALAVLYDPSNALARGLSGLVSLSGEMETSGRDQQDCRRRSPPKRARAAIPGAPRQDPGSC